MPALLACVALAQSSRDEAEALFRSGLESLRDGRVAEASDRLEGAVKLQPESALLWLAVADVRLKLGNVKRAEEAARIAVQLAPSDAVARKAGAMFHSRLAKSPELAGDAARISKNLELALQLDPERESYYLEFARFLLDSGAHEPASNVLAAANQRFPASIEAIRLSGLAYYARGLKRPAIETFLKLIDMNATLESSYASLETLLPQAGPLLPEIIVRLERYRTLRPSEPLPYYLLALAKPEQEEALLRQAIAHAPDFWPARYELHKSLRANGDFKAAAEELRRVIELNGEYAPAYYALARIEGHLGDRETARAARETHHRLLSEKRKAPVNRTLPAP